MTDSAPAAEPLNFINNAFTHHPPFGDQAERYSVIRDWGRETGGAIMRACPDSPERDKSIERLREAVMWANASIACNERPPA